MQCPVMHGLSQQQHVVFCGMKWSGHFCHFSLLTASKQFLNFINALIFGHFESAVEIAKEVTAGDQ